MNWWQNLSVSKKLYTVVGVMALLIVGELLTLSFATTTLSAVRAVVGAEGIWSKAHKTSLHHLQKYAHTHDEKYYQLYLERLKIPLGDRQARLQLEQTKPDHKLITEGFISGGIHPDDIDSIISLVQRFHWIPRVDYAIGRWREGDRKISVLMALGESLHETIQREPKNTKKIEHIMKQIFEWDEILTQAESNFSAYLGEVSRWIEKILLFSLLILVILVEGTGIFLAISFARRLTKSLNELNQVANKVGEGDFSKRIKVTSNDELGQLALSLNKMTENLQCQVNERQHAEHASEAKNLFLANMSHEIRTPLNAILGFSEILSDPDLSLQERSHYSAIIKRTGSGLTSIINDILDVTKVEAEQLNIILKTFSLNQLMTDLHAILRLRCDEKGVVLVFQKEGDFTDTIQSDPARLRQILANIVGNSIKFTEQGNVHVKYEVIGTELVFTVSDTGTGISQDQIKRLFKPFSQGDSSIRKKFGGTGLGLLIAQKLAQLLGGDVFLQESKKKRGSIFTIKIAYSPKPLAEIENIKTNTEIFPISMNNLLEGKRILVVEDSLDNQLLAELYLTRSGAQVQFANNGLEGLQRMQNELFDIVLMDIQMPVMDGYAATQEARQAGLRVPIIALTGFAMKDDQQKCLDAGCNDYLAKPFNRQSLIQCVAKHQQTAVFPQPALNPKYS